MNFPYRNYKLTPSANTKELLLEEGKKKNSQVFLHHRILFLSFFFFSKWDSLKTKLGEAIYRQIGSSFTMRMVAVNF